IDNLPEKDKEYINSITANQEKFDNFANNILKNIAPEEKDNFRKDNESLQKLAKIAAENQSKLDAEEAQRKANEAEAAVAATAANDAKAEETRRKETATLAKALASQAVGDALQAISGATDKLDFIELLSKEDKKKLLYNMRAALYAAMAEQYKAAQDKAEQSTGSTTQEPVETSSPDKITAENSTERLNTKLSKYYNKIRTLLYGEQNPTPNDDDLYQIMTLHFPTTSEDREFDEQTTAIAIGETVYFSKRNPDGTFALDKDGNQIQASKARNKFETLPYKQIKELYPDIKPIAEKGNILIIPSQEDNNHTPNLSSTTIPASPSKAPERLKVTELPNDAIVTTSNTPSEDVNVVIPSIKLKPPPTPGADAKTSQQAPSPGK
ncbi:MAG: hypothetical protein AAF195_00445, partial [Pseudomonadota bacterium]